MQITREVPCRLIMFMHSTGKSIKMSDIVRTIGTTQAHCFKLLYGFKADEIVNYEYPVNSLRRHWFLTEKGYNIAEELNAIRRLSQ